MRLTMSSSLTTDANTSRAYTLLSRATRYADTPPAYCTKRHSPLDSYLGWTTVQDRQVAASRRGHSLKSYVFNNGEMKCR